MRVLCKYYALPTQNRTFLVSNTEKKKHRQRFSFSIFYMTKEMDYNPNTL